MATGPDDSTTNPTGRLGFGEKILEAAAAAGVILLSLILFRYWKILPQSVPWNFDPLGNVTSWGSKRLLGIISLTVVSFYLIITAVSRFPHRFSYPWPITVRNARAQYRIGRSFLLWVKTEVVWLYTFIQWKTVQVALGEAAGLGPLFMPMALLIVNGTIVAAVCRAYSAR